MIKTSGDAQCLHLRGSRCSALKVRSCSKECSYRLTDPVKYLKMLLDMICYNKTNPHQVAGYRKEIKALGIEDPYDGWEEVYKEEQRRGKGGGSSEGDTSNSAASMKQKMKDNRARECKLTIAQRAELKEMLTAWEEENGKLEHLGRSSMGKSKVDSYTGEEIPKKGKGYC